MARVWLSFVLTYFSSFIHRPISEAGETGGVRRISRKVEGFMIVYDTSEGLDRLPGVAKWQKIFLSCTDGHRCVEE